MRLLILLLAAVTAAVAQPDSNVITITAYRQSTVQPDQVNVAVSVTTDAGQTLDSMLAQLAPAQITVGDFSGASGFGTSQVQWTFSPAMTLSDMTKRLTALAGLKQTGSFMVGYYLQGSTVSAQAAAAQPCPYAALISDARAQAGKLAAAAGMTAGPIVAITPAAGQAAAPAAYRVGDFAVLASVNFLFGFVAPSTLISSPLPSCSLSVHFKLG